ncbi:MAG: trypsin-like peptidase domain-containing protein [Candidatus Pacebacteria bacterium]|nr:trypsin-like peptidase domain-containing protein [Candidatus Paceibacterota bacterium]
MENEEKNEEMKNGLALVSEKIEASGPETEEKYSIFGKKGKNRHFRRRGHFLLGASLFVLFLFFNALFSYTVVDYAIKKNDWSMEQPSGENRIFDSIRVVDEQSQVIEVAEKASPAVVSIVAIAEVPTYETSYNDFFNFRIPSRVQNGTEEMEVSAGTGFLVSSDGYIITNRHVVEDEDVKYTVILNDKSHLDEEIEAEVLARDPNNDIAILKIDKNDLPFLNLGDSDEIHIGQTAIAIGYSLGEFENTVSKGVISGLYRSISAYGSISGVENLENLIQTDAAVNPGNSGGPLLDIDGNVIGVNVAMADAQSIGFAIPVNDVKSSYEEVKISGTIKKDAQAFLGVRYVVVDSTVQKNNDLPYNYGVIISRGETAADLAVVPGSPADKVGLVENDIILEVDGEKITEKNPLTNLIRKYKPGDEVVLRIYHKGEEKEIAVILGENGN